MVEAKPSDVDAQVHLPVSALTRGPARSQARRVHHRPVHAEPHVATVRQGDRAPEAGPEAARHGRLHSQLGGDAELGAHRAHRLEHAGRPTRVHRCPSSGVPLEQHGEQVGDITAVARVSVFACKPDLAALRRAHPPHPRARVPEADQCARGHADVRELAAPDRQRREPDSAADQDRAGDLRTELGRPREGPTEWPGDPQAVAWLEARRAARSRGQPPPRGSRAAGPRPRAAPPRPRRPAADRADHPAGPSRPRRRA